MSSIRAQRSLASEPLECYLTITEFGPPRVLLKGVYFSSPQSATTTFPPETFLDNHRVWTP